MLVYFFLMYHFVHFEKNNLRSKLTLQNISPFGTCFYGGGAGYCPRVQNTYFIQPLVP